MGRCGTLDAAGAAQVIGFRKALRTSVLLLTALFCLPSFCLPVFHLPDFYLPDQAQTDPTPAAKRLFEHERWPELVQLLQQAPRNSADLDYYYGVALAHLQRWEEASRALSAGQLLAP